MNPTLPPYQQLTALERAKTYLEDGVPSSAYRDLCNAIRETPTESPLYPVMVGAANWISPCNHPELALQKLTAFLAELSTPNSQPSTPCV